MGIICFPKVGLSTNFFQSQFEFQVHLFLLWVSYLHAIGFSPSEAIWVNMDETPIPYFSGGRFGTRSKRQLDPTKRLKRQTPPLRVTRGHATLVASMCTDPTVQKHLPQVFMPNTKGMKKKWEGVSATVDLPDNIQVQMGTTG